MNRRQIIIGAAAVVAAPVVSIIPEVQAAPVAVEEMFYVGGRWLTRDQLNQQLWQLMRYTEYEMIRDHGHDTWGREWTLEEWHACNGPDAPVWPVQVAA